MKSRLGKAIFLAFLLFSIGDIVKSKIGEHPSIPCTQAEGKDTQEITHILIEKWLEHFIHRLFYFTTRISDYEIEEIQAHDYLEDGFIAFVIYSVKPFIPRLDAYWMVGGGFFDKQSGWLKHQALFFRVIKANNKYSLKIIGTCT